MPVVLTGPFFEDRDRVMAKIKAEVEKDVATVGFAIVKTNLITFIRNPTPYYWTRMVNRANPEGDGRSIFDNWVVYGPWLEGNGSKNFPVTRFKGYASYRKGAQELERRSGVIADRAIARRIGDLN